MLTNVRRVEVGHAMSHLLELRLRHARDYLKGGHRDHAMRVVTDTRRQVSEGVFELPHPAVVLDFLGAIADAPWHSSDDDLARTADAALEYVRTLI